MATGAQAVELISQATGIPEATVERGSKVLKQFVPNLWPRSGQGGGKSAKHVQPFDLVNLVLAMAAADPITSAPAVVAQYRQLYPMYASTAKTSVSFEEGDHGVAFVSQSFGGLTAESTRLGDYLEALIGLLSVATPTDDALARLRDGWSCVLSIGSIPRAIVSRTESDGSLTNVTYEDLGRSQQMLNFSLPKPTATAPMLRQVTIPFSLMEVLGAIYADTLRQTSQPELPSPPSDPSPGPETTEAAMGTTPTTASEFGHPATKSPGALDSTDDIHTHGVAATPESHGGRSQPDRKANPHAYLPRGYRPGGSDRAAA